MLFWGVLPFMVFYKTLVVSFDQRITDDFEPLHKAMRRFIDRTAVYSENYSDTDPHYLYNPGSTLLLSPFGLIDNYDLARNIFICINAACIIIALGLLTKLFGFSLKHFIWPLSIISILFTEGGAHTLQFANINGVLLLGICIFFWGFIRGHSLLAGVAIGCAALFKPMLLPIVLLPLIARRWGIALGAITTPILLNLIAWPVVPQANDYLTKLVPYLAITRDYFNVSIAGITAFYDLPPVVHYSWWLLVAIAAGIALVVLSRWRFTDTLLWLVTSTTLIVVAVPTLSNLGQQYYSIFAFPLVFTLFHARSVIHNPVVAASMLAFYCHFDYSITHYKIIDYLGLLPCTLAWSLFIIASAVVIVSWWRTEQMSSGKAYDEGLHSPLRGAMAEETVAD